MAQPDQQLPDGNPFLASSSTSSENGKTLVLHPQSLGDEQLWEAFKSDDDQALVLIFDRYTQVLFNYGIKVLTDDEVVKDAIQDLFIELWKNRHTLGRTDSIKYYLFKSLRRKLIRIKSSKQNKLLATPEHDFIQWSHETDLIHLQDLKEKREKVLKMLDSITNRQKEAIFLRYFEELSYEHIAQVMELNKQAVYNLIHQGLKNLRKEFF